MKNLEHENEKLKNSLEIITDAFDVQSRINDKLREDNKKMKAALEACLYWTSTRDPEINTHKQACDAVEEITKKFFIREIK